MSKNVKINRPNSAQPIPDHAQKVFSGKIFDVYQWEQEMYDGTKTTFEKLKRPDSVVVFMIDDEGRIILANQEQPGKKAFISAIGGRVEPGEDVLEAAKRELLEETGYVAEVFELFQAEHVMSKIDWVIYVFIAKRIKKVAEQDLDGGEKISLIRVTFDELLDLATEPHFSEKEVVTELLQAKNNPMKYAALKNLFTD